ELPSWEPLALAPVRFLSTRPERSPGLGARRARFASARAERSPGLGAGRRGRRTCCGRLLRFGWLGSLGLRSRPLGCRLLAPLELAADQGLLLERRSSSFTRSHARRRRPRPSPEVRIVLGLRRRGELLELGLRKFAQSSGFPPLKLRVEGREHLASTLDATAARLVVVRGILGDRAVEPSASAP